MNSHQFSRPEGIVDEIIAALNQSVDFLAVLYTNQTEILRRIQQLSTNFTFQDYFKLDLLR
jgi:hypothetical protein